MILVGGQNQKSGMLINRKYYVMDKELVNLVETAQWARNRLELIADDSWHGDGRDLKRSIIGIFSDFDSALAACGSRLPEELKSINTSNTFTENLRKAAIKVVNQDAKPEYEGKYFELRAAIIALRTLLINNKESHYNNSMQEKLEDERAITRMQNAQIKVLTEQNNTYQIMLDCAVDTLDIIEQHANKHHVTTTFSESTLRRGHNVIKEVVRTRLAKIRKMQNE